MAAAPACRQAIDRGTPAQGPVVEIGQRVLRPAAIHWLTAGLALDDSNHCDVNATMIDDGLVEFVRDLKQQRGGDVGVHASISVAQALLAADVVDELRLVIGPMIVGRGRRLLDGLPAIQLELIRSEISPTGYLLVDYRVIR